MYFLTPAAILAMAASFAVAAPQPEVNIQISAAVSTTSLVVTY
jgi:hypothetical protein